MSSERLLSPSQQKPRPVRRYRPYRPWIDRILLTASYLPATELAQKQASPAFWSQLLSLYLKNGHRIRWKTVFKIAIHPVQFGNHRHDLARFIQRIGVLRTIG